MATPEQFDFVKDKSATPERMNAFVAYLDARFRALEAVTPAFVAAIDQLKAVGLERLAEALIPIFERATDIDEELQALQDTYAADTFKADQAAAILTTLRAGVAAEFDTLAKMAAKLVDYRSKYLGAKAVQPTVDDNGAAVTSGAMYFDTVLGRMRVYTGTTWQDAGSIVAGLMERQAFTATGGETSVTVPGGYDPGNIIVAVNGQTLSPSDVVVTSGTVITGFPAALAAGDEVSWTKFGAITLANVYDKAASDARFALISGVYSKTAADALLAAKASISTTYTKSEVDAYLASLALTDTMKANAADVYSKTAADARYLASAGTGYGSNANGYWEKRPNGVIEQWGKITAAANGTSTITFPIAFTDLDSISCSGNGVGELSNSAQDNFASVYMIPDVNSATVFSASNGSSVFFWRAIGR